MAELKDYTDEIQHLFLQFLISDPDLFARCQNIVDPEFFNHKFRSTVKLLKTHSTDYNAIPTIEQINAIGRLGLEVIPNVTPDHQAWFMDEFETFCKHKALARAIVESSDLLEEHNYGEVENKIKAAVQLGLVKDLGLDYFADPKARLQWIKDQAGAISGHGLCRAPGPDLSAGPTRQDRR